MWSESSRTDVALLRNSLVTLCDLITIMRKHGGWTSPVCEAAYQRAVEAITAVDGKRPEFIGGEPETK